MDVLPVSAESREIAVGPASQRAGILQRAPLAVIEFNRDLRLVGWNDAAERMLGHGRAEALGQRVDEMLPVHGDPDAWRRLLGEEESAAPRVWSHRRKGGDPASVEWFHERLLDERGAVTGVALFGHDVTQRVEEERRHKEKEQILRAMTRNLPIVVWAIDLEGTFTFHEGKAAASAGLAEGDLVGKNAFELYREGDGAAGLRQALAGEAAYNVALQHEVWWESWQIPVRDERGDVRSVVGCSLDITATKRTEQELRDRLQVIERQQQVIRDLSTPIIQVWDGVLTLPMIGVVDSVRTAEVMDSLLDAVARTRARYAILDLTGVDTVDTRTAGYLIELVRAIRLLGAEGIISGIRPNVAQTIVTLGIDLASLTTLSNLRAALKHCILQMRTALPEGAPAPAPQRR